MILTYVLEDFPFFFPPEYLGWCDQSLYFAVNIYFTVFSYYLDANNDKIPSASTVINSRWHCLCLDLCLKDEDNVNEGKLNVQFANWAEILTLERLLLVLTWSFSQYLALCMSQKTEDNQVILPGIMNLCWQKKLISKSSTAR